MTGLETDPAPRRPIGPYLLTAFFAFLALNAGVQVVLPVLGRSGDPPLLVALQALVTATGVSAAAGSWRRARWSPAAALVHGIATAAMLLSLPPILDMAPDARGGIQVGAAVMIGIGAGAAWYLRRVVAREAALRSTRGT